MPRFFVDEISETTVLYGEDARHISKSLRMSCGESLTLCDKNGGEADGVIVSFSADAVTVKTGKLLPSKSEAQTHLALYAALPKGDKLELVVQKAVELGVFEITPVITSRCISRPKDNDLKKKQERLQRIALEAAKQCGRGIIPAVRPILSFKDALTDIARHRHRFVLYEGSCPPLRPLLPQKGSGIALFIGSEGGFSPEEIAACEKNGVRAVSLGKRILRCETASIAAVAAVMFYLGEME